MARSSTRLTRDDTTPEERIEHSSAAADGTGSDGLTLPTTVFIARTRAEAEMLQLAAIVASSDDAILSVTLDGVISSWNAGAERTYGYSAAEAVGRPSAMLLPENRRDEIKHILARIRRGELVDHYETVRVRKDGTHLLVSLSVSPIKDVAGRVIGAASIARDITERERAAARLREMQKLAQQRERLADIGAITAEIIHEIGNPLAGISAQAQLILRRAGRAPAGALDAVAQPAERILGEVWRLEALIRDFQTFARAQHLRLAPVDVARFLEESLALWQPVAAARAITLRAERPDALPPLVADDEKLRRALDNLVKNAIEAIGAGPGWVTIRITLPEPDALHIAVVDSGPGIPETVRGFRLFETTKPDGTGLGLAIAQNIVVAHHGRIDFARTAEGTVFRIELPLAAPPA